MGEPFRVGYCRCSTDEQDVEIQPDQLLTLGVPRDRADETMRRISENRELWQVVGRRNQLRRRRADLTQQRALLESKMTRWQAVRDAADRTEQFLMPQQSKSAADTQMALVKCCLQETEQIIEQLDKEATALVAAERQNNAAFEEFLAFHSSDAEGAYLRYTEELGQKMFAAQTSRDVNVATFDDTWELIRPATMIQTILAADNELMQTGWLLEAYAAEEKSLLAAKQRRPEIETAQWDYAAALLLGKTWPSPAFAPPAEILAEPEWSARARAAGPESPPNNAPKVISASTPMERSIPMEIKPSVAESSSEIRAPSMISKQEKRRAKPSSDVMPPAPMSGETAAAFLYRSEEEEIKGIEFLAQRIEVPFAPLSDSNKESFIK